MYVVIECYRHNFQELSKSEQDLLLLSKIQSLHCILGLNKVYASQTQRRQLRKHRAERTERGLQQLNIAYHFGNLTVCQKLFFIMHQSAARL